MDMMRPLSRRRREDRFSSAVADDMMERPFSSRRFQREMLVSEEGIPVTRGGTMGGTAGTKRTVQDRNYYLGFLTVKINQLFSEINKIKQNVDKEMREQAVYHIYDKRVKTLVLDLTEAQGLLMDYNLTIERLNSETNLDLQQIVQEIRKLQAENDMELKNVEEMYTERTRKQDAATKIENQIKNEKDKAIEIMTEMDDSVKDILLNLKYKNNMISEEKARYHTQLDSVNKVRTSLGDQIFSSPANEEAFRLRMKLEQIEFKRKSLENKFNPLTNKGNYLEDYKSDTNQIGLIENAIKELKKKINDSQRILSDSKQIKDEVLISRNSKFLDLKKKEESMEDFMSKFESMKDEESLKLKSMENEIIASLKILTNAVSRLPTATDYRALYEKSDMSNKSVALNTLSSLITEYKENVSYLNKISIIDKHIKSDLEGSKTKISDMLSDLRTMSDLDKVKENHEEFITELSNIKEDLQSQYNNTIANNKEANKYHRKIQKTLVGNETHAQLVYLEKKLGMVEQSNYSVLEYLGSIVQEEDMLAYCSQIMSWADKINSDIIFNLHPNDNY